MEFCREKIFPLFHPYIQLKKGTQMMIELYSKVLLKNGKTATVIEILNPQKAFLVDVDLPGPDWETIQVEYDDIKSFV
jgi:acetone carboxylase gamma subunit